MRVVLQRVGAASVEVGGSIVGQIGPGMLLLVGVEDTDSDADVQAAAAKIAGLRIFPDDEGKMNRSVSEVGGSALVVSQFTLLADVTRGRRPSFTGAGDPGHAEPLVRRFAEEMELAGVPTATGRFGDHMQVSLVNDGPVTLLVETKDGRIV